MFFLILFVILSRTTTLATKDLETFTHDTTLATKDSENLTHATTIYINALIDNKNLFSSKVLINIYFEKDQVI